VYEENRLRGHRSVAFASGNSFGGLGKPDFGGVGKLELHKFGERD
jgi:hypothetical protein